jgi:hypothetical protein
LILLGNTDRQYCMMMEELTRQGANVSSSSQLQYLFSFPHQMSLWGMILRRMIQLVLYDGSDQGSQSTWRTSLVEKALSYGADTNTSIFWNYYAKLGPGHQCGIVLEGSALSYIENCRIYRGLHCRKEISDLLRSRGALQRHRFRLIQLRRERPNNMPAINTWYQLSRDQSDRLFDAYDGRFLFDFDDDVSDDTQEALRHVIKEFETSLKEDDIVDTSTFVLRPSLQIEDEDGEA